MKYSPKRYWDIIDRTNSRKRFGYRNWQKLQRASVDAALLRVALLSSVKRKHAHGDVRCYSGILLLALTDAVHIEEILREHPKKRCAADCRRAFHRFYSGFRRSGLSPSMVGLSPEPFGCDSNTDTSRAWEPTSSCNQFPCRPFASVNGMPPCLCFAGQPLPQVNGVGDEGVAFECVPESWDQICGKVRLENIAESPGGRRGLDQVRVVVGRDEDHLANEPSSLRRQRLQFRSLPASKYRARRCRA